MATISSIRFYHLPVLAIALLLLAGVAGCTKNNKTIRAKTATVLILDAAHGGSDNGNTLPGGQTEKALVLKMCQRMAAMASEYNIQVVQTRTNDEGVSGDQRVAISNAARPGVFLSMHINKNAAGSAVRGYEIYVSPKSAQYEASKRVAASLIPRLAMGGLSSVVTDKNVYVQEHNLQPALSIECGHMDYVPELELFENDAKLEDLCRLILSGIVDYSNGG